LDVVGGGGGLVGEVDGLELHVFHRAGEVRLSRWPR